jgi:hypothetical protein
MASCTSGCVRAVRCAGTLVNHGKILQRGAGVFGVGVGVGVRRRQLLQLLGDAGAVQQAHLRQQRGGGMLPRNLPDGDGASRQPPVRHGGRAV